VRIRNWIQHHEIKLEERKLSDPAIFVTDKQSKRGGKLESPAMNVRSLSVINTQSSFVNA
jgi:hypothetical protein